MVYTEDRKPLKAADWVIIAFYFLACILVGLWTKFRQQRGKTETAESFFLAGRSMMWWAVGPSLFVSNIGSEHFIGLAGSGAATGIGVASYEWQAPWILLLLGWVFVPIYLKSRIYTTPEYLLKRFHSTKIRTCLTAVALISYVLTKISVDIYAGSVFLYEAVGWNIYVSAAVILAITAVYTVLGGLTAVFFTDVLQCTIMVIGGIVVAIMSFAKVGGLDGLWSKFGSSMGKPLWSTASSTNFPSTGTSVVNSNLSSTAATTVADTLGKSNDTIDSCYKLTPYWGDLWRPVDDPDYPWLGLWTSLFITAVWYFCTDQVLVQRALGAKSHIQARAGTIFAGFLKILPMFVMVMPGMISRVLFPNSIACHDPKSCEIACDNRWGCTNNAYPKLVLNILPTGMVGLMLAVMMAAVMSSLSSAFNSSATIFTVDVWLRLRPQARDREKIIVGRVVVAALVGVSLCWLPIVKGFAGNQLFVYLQNIQSYFAPAISSMFLLGILWTGLTENAAFTGLLVGFAMGLIKFIVENVYAPPDCGEEDTRPQFAKLHFMYYSNILFAISVFTMVVVSLFTKRIPRDELGGLTWPTINEPPLAHGAIGEDVEALEKSTTMQMEDKSESFVNDSPSASMTFKPEVKVEKIKLPVVEFPEEEPWLKWLLRISTIALLVTLIGLWIRFA